jgi:hypothetical protein
MPLARQRRGAEAPWNTSRAKRRMTAPSGDRYGTVHLQPRPCFSSRNTFPEHRMASPGSEIIVAARLKLSKQRPQTSSEIQNHTICRKALDARPRILFSPNTSACIAGVHRPGHGSPLRSGLLELGTRGQGGQYRPPGPGRFPRLGQPGGFRQSGQRSRAPGRPIADARCPESGRTGPVPA